MIDSTAGFHLQCLAAVPSSCRTSHLSIFIGSKHHGALILSGLGPKLAAKCGIIMKVFKFLNQACERNNTDFKNSEVRKSFLQILRNETLKRKQWR